MTETRLEEVVTDLETAAYKIRPIDLVPGFGPNWHSARCVLSGDVVNHPLQVMARAVPLQIYGKVILPAVGTAISSYATYQFAEMISNYW